MDEIDYLISQVSEGDLNLDLDLDPDLQMLNSTFSGLFDVPDCASVPEIGSNVVPGSVSEASSSRFVRKSDEQLEVGKSNSVPKNTARNTAWAVKTWKQWSAHRQQAYPAAYSEWPVHLFIANNHHLDYWLSKFVLEARSDGEPYPPNTLYSHYEKILVS